MSDMALRGLVGDMPAIEGFLLLHNAFCYSHKRQQCHWQTIQQLYSEQLKYSVVYD